MAPTDSKSTGKSDGKGSLKNEKSALVDKNYDAKRNYEPEFKGPIRDRSCTDVICCLLFIVCFCGLIFIGIWGFINGDYRKVLYPTDSQGNLCGIDIKDKEYLLFFDLVKCMRNPVVLTTGCLTPQVCVTKCPTYYWAWVPAFTKEEAQKVINPAHRDTAERKKMVCVDDVNGNDPKYIDKTIKELVDQHLCAPYIVKTGPLFGRCIPTAMADLINSVAGVENFTLTDAKNNTIGLKEIQKGSAFLAKFLAVSQVAQNVLQDLVISWYFIVMLMGVGALVSLLWVVLLRFTAAIMVWVTIIAFVCFFGFATGYSLYKYRQLSKTQITANNIEFKTSLTYYLKLKETWLILGIIAVVFLVIVLLMLLFLRSRIRIATALIGEASRAVGYIMTSLIWPIFPFLMEVCALGICLVIGVHLASVGKPTGKLVGNYSTLEDTSLRATKAKIESLVPCDPTKNGTFGQVCQFVKYDAKQYLLAFQFYNIFMYFWLFNFIIALGQMTLAGAFASYYFAFSKPRDIPTFPLLSSFWRCFRYHLGTLAFGSLLIAIVQVIRVILEYIDHKTKDNQNPCAQFVLKCMKCCMWCLEKFLKFLTKNAYIMTAIYGQCFCIAAKNAFSLILRNFVRVFVVDKMTDFLLFIGKLVVVGAVGSLAFFFFDGTIGTKVRFVKSYTPELNYYFIPVIIIIISTYIVASLFFSVYSMAVDTLFLCFLEDLERNDGSPEKPYYMSSELMKILGKSNTKMKAEEKKKGETEM